MTPFNFAAGATVIIGHYLTMWLGECGTQKRPLLTRTRRRILFKTRVEKAPTPKGATVAGESMGTSQRGKFPAWEHKNA